MKPFATSRACVASLAGVAGLLLTLMSFVAAAVVLQQDAWLRVAEGGALGNQKGVVRMCLRGTEGCKFSELERAPRLSTLPCLDWFPQAAVARRSCCLRGSAV
jgi:hypothetical protein